MPDTYSIKPQIYNISHANTNVDFITKKGSSVKCVDACRVERIALT